MPSRLPLLLAGLFMMPLGCVQSRALTLYNAPPSIARYELGDDNLTHGDVIAWHADLAVDLDESRIGDGDGASARVIGHCNGTMIVTRDRRESDDREHRMTTIELDWDDTDDSILVSGAHPYRHGQVETDTAIIRAIVGGTGRFAGAAGEMISTRLPNGWYRHEVRLVD